MTTTAQERVQAGVAYLDAEFPGWEAYVNRYTLQMVLGDHCILGQLRLKDPRLAAIPVVDGSSPYTDAVKYLCPDWDLKGFNSHPWAIEHGFVGDDGAGPVRYDHLQSAWLSVLEERQATFAVRPGSTPEPAPMTPAEDEEFRDEYESRGIFGDE